MRFYCQSVLLSCFLSTSQPFNLVPSQAVCQRVRRGAIGIWRFSERIHWRCSVSILLALEVDMFNYYVSCSNAKADSISDSITCKYIRNVDKIQKDRLKPFLYLLNINLDCHQMFPFLQAVPCLGDDDVRERWREHVEDGAVEGR